MRKNEGYKILKHKDIIKNDWVRGCNGYMKRKQNKTFNEDINSIVLEWLTDARSQNIPISRPIIQEKLHVDSEK